MRLRLDTTSFSRFDPTGRTTLLQQRLVTHGIVLWKRGQRAGIYLTDCDYVRA